MNTNYKAATYSCFSWKCTCVHFTNCRAKLFIWFAQAPYTHKNYICNWVINLLFIQSAQTPYIHGTYYIYLWSHICAVHCWWRMRLCCSRSRKNSLLRIHKQKVAIYIEWRLVWRRILHVPVFDKTPTPFHILFEEWCAFSTPLSQRAYLENKQKYEVSSWHTCFRVTSYVSLFASILHGTDALS